MFRGRYQLYLPYLKGSRTLLALSLLAAIVFALLSGINYATHYLALVHRTPRPYGQDPELRWFFGVLAVTVVFLLLFALWAAKWSSEKSSADWPIFTELRGPHLMYGSGGLGRNHSRLVVVAGGRIVGLYLYH